MLPVSMRMAALLQRTWFAVALSLLAVTVYLLVGERALLGLSAGLPLLVLLALRSWPAAPEPSVSEQVVSCLDAALGDRIEGPRQTGCLVLQFDDTSRLCDRHGRSQQSEILAASIRRIRGALRGDDRLFTLEDGSLVVVLAPSRGLDLAGLTRIAGRLHLVAQQPMVLGEAPVHLTCCIGYCHARQLPVDTGFAMLEACQIAADEARLHGPGAMRAYTADLALARNRRDALRRAFSAAVAAGQIRASFQPQVSTDSGEVSGVEALVRWHHPDRGILSPGEFLPDLEGTDLMAVLGREMLDQSLAALAFWDREGLAVPMVAVNFSPEELRDPLLPDRLVWALDAHKLKPDRLTVEVPESLVAAPGDDVLRANLDRIARMGCGIDLDDFGTGNASITTLRHLAVRRLKIDRSFVQGVDQIQDQQNLVIAILSLAEQLGYEAVAEGVETHAEHAMLAQLGCAHVQGYVIARPFPVEEAGRWLRAHRERLPKALQIAMRAR